MTQFNATIATAGAAGLLGQYALKQQPRREDVVTLKRVEQELDFRYDERQLIVELIREAADEFRRKANLGLYYAKDQTEYVPGNGGKRIVLRQFAPVESINKIVLINGGVRETVPSNQYRIEDASSGFIHRKTGHWLNTESYTYRINPQMLGEDMKLYEVTYTGGYRNRVQKENPESNVTYQDIPRDIERAIIDRVKERYFARTRDPGVKQERILSASIKYDYATDSGPSYFDEIVTRYKRWA